MAPLSASLWSKLLHLLLSPLRYCQKIGQLMLLVLHSIEGFVKSARRGQFPFHLTLHHMAEIGFNSLPIVIASSIFTGMVMVVQVGSQFEKFGAKPYIGGAIALTIAREVGPVLTAIILAGRIGSAFAAELGTMVVTEQIDALRSLATDPIEYLVLPRILACASMLLFLTIIFNFLGLIGGYSVASPLIQVSWDIYFDSVKKVLTLYDILGGLLKSVIFGIIVAAVSCNEGFRTGGGARGVGKGTTRAVVHSILFILLANLLMTVALVNFQESPIKEEIEKILKIQ